MNVEVDDVPFVLTATAWDAENYDSRGDSLSSNCQMIRQGLRCRLITFKKKGQKLTYKYLIKVMPISVSLCQWSNSLDMSRFPRQPFRWSVSQLCVVTPFLLTPSRIQSHETTLFRHKPFELSVSPTRSVQSTIMLIWLQSISEFIGQLDDNFAQSLIVKYSDKADSPLESVSGKLDNRKRGAQHLKLTQSGW